MGKTIWFVGVAVLISIILFFSLPRCFDTPSSSLGPGRRALNPDEKFITVFALDAKGASSKMDKAMVPFSTNDGEYTCLMVSMPEGVYTVIVLEDLPNEATQRDKVLVKEVEKSMSSFFFDQVDMDTPYLVNIMNRNLSVVNNITFKLLKTCP